MKKPKNSDEPEPKPEPKPEPQYSLISRDSIVKNSTEPMYMSPYGSEVLVTPTQWDEWYIEPIPNLNNDTVKFRGDEKCLTYVNDRELKMEECTKNNEFQIFNRIMIMPEPGIDNCPQAYAFEVANKLGSYIGYEDGDGDGIGQVKIETPTRINNPSNMARWCVSETVP